MHGYHTLYCHDDIRFFMYLTMSYNDSKLFTGSAPISFWISSTSSWASGCHDPDACAWCCSISLCEKQFKKNHVPIFQQSFQSFMPLLHITRYKVVTSVDRFLYNVREIASRSKTTGICIMVMRKSLLMFLLGW